MVTLLHVVILHPVECELNRAHELAIIEGVFSITGDVESVQTHKRLHKLLIAQSVINGNHSRATCLQKVGMRTLKESGPAICLDLFVLKPCAWDGLGQDPKDGVVRPGSKVVTRLQKDRLHVKTTEVMRRIAVWKEVKLLRTYHLTIASGAKACPA